MTNVVLSQQLTDELEMVSDHLNHEHADTIAFIARCHPSFANDRGDERVETAKISRIDAVGLALEAQVSAGRLELVHPFGAPPDKIEDVRVHLFGLLAEARQAAGDDEPITSIEQEMSGGDGILTFLTTVVETELITPNLRRIRFSGGLEDFESLGAEQFLFVLIPPAGGSVDRDFSWEKNNELPEDQQVGGAYYTVRDWQRSANGPGAEWIDMWFVLHDEGLAGSWAASVEPGTSAALWGPRQTFEPPASTGRLLLVADETGYGAVGALLDEMVVRDQPLPVSVVLEAADESQHVPMPTGPTIDIRWVHRGDAPPGSTSLLVDAVRNLELGDGVYAYGAGESKCISAVRRYLRNERDLPHEQVQMVAYWRRSDDSD